jgi:glycerate kinase
VKVVVAPDKFKGTLTAGDAAEAIAEGWRQGDPSARVDVAPLADGGEGTLDALAPAMGAAVRRERVTGPMGDPVEAAFGLAGDVGIVEAARACGLGLVAERDRDPLRATTFGVGELIAAACRAGAARVLVGLGGSATNDGGAGMAQAVGFGLLDGTGADLPRGGGALAGLDRIDASRVDPAVRAAAFVGLTDVDSPLTGPRGASKRFAPQKGASNDDVVALDAALERLADVAEHDLGTPIRDLPGAGAAGGLGAGLAAFLGATLESGVRAVMAAVGFASRLDGADLVVTGEGAFDEQSLGGKVPWAVVREARARTVPAVVLCGRASVGLAGATVISLVERFGERRAMEDPAECLRRAAFDLASQWPGGRADAPTSTPATRAAPSAPPGRAT